MELFGIGIPEIGLVALIALVIVGPRRFPEVAREVARWIRSARALSDSVMVDVRAAVQELEQEVTTASDGVNPIRELDALRRELTGIPQEVASAASAAADLPPLAESPSAESPLPESPALESPETASAAEWAAVAEITDTGAAPAEQRQAGA